MNNFNLLVSSSRFNEINAKAELWFTLFFSGDKYPILFSSEFSGLIAASSSLNGKVFISKVKDVLSKDPNFFQFILKIIPIDYVCETDVKVINQIVQQHYKYYISDKESFRIDLKRRSNEEIDRDVFIDTIAKNIHNKVDLENPNKIIRFEILGNYCGIAFLKSDEIIRITPRFNTL